MVRRYTARPDQLKADRLRPSDPPISTGLPVTTAVTVWFLCIEYVSMIHAITRSFVFTSGAGTSESGPSVAMIPAIATTAAKVTGSVGETPYSNPDRSRVVPNAATVPMSLRYEAVG